MEGLANGISEEIGLFFDAEYVGEVPDRTYATKHFCQYFAPLIRNGVFYADANYLKVVANNDMSVTVQKGFAMINGSMYILPFDKKIQIDVADGVLNRKDIIVVRRDELTRLTDSRVVKGEFATNAVTPALQQDVDAWELHLATISVNKGITAITNGEIKDERENVELVGVDSKTVTEKLENDFNTWFEEIKEFFGEDAVNELKDKIQDINIELEKYLLLAGGELTGNLFVLNNDIYIGNGRRIRTYNATTGGVVSLLYADTSNNVELGFTSANRVALVGQTNPIYYNGTSVYQLYHNGYNGTISAASLGVNIEDEEETSTFELHEEESVIDQIAVKNNKLDIHSNNLANIPGRLLTTITHENPISFKHKESEDIISTEVYNNTKNIVQDDYEIAATEQKEEQCIDIYALITELWKDARIKSAKITELEKRIVELEQ